MKTNSERIPARHTILPDGRVEIIGRQGRLRVVVPAEVWADYRAHCAGDSPEQMDARARSGIITRALEHRRYVEEREALWAIVQKQQSGTPPNVIRAQARERLITTRQIGYLANSAYGMKGVVRWQGGGMLSEGLMRAVADARMQATMDVDLHCQDALDRAVVIDTPEARRLAFLNMRTGDNVQQDWIVEDLP